jgi:hypothetical protein
MAHCTNRPRLPFDLAEDVWARAYEREVPTPRRHSGRFRRMSVMQQLQSFGMQRRTRTPGHEETLASKASCRTKRLVHSRQPTFVNEYAMTVDRPLRKLEFSPTNYRNVHGSHPSNVPDRKFRIPAAGGWFQKSGRELPTPWRHWRMSAIERSKMASLIHLGALETPTIMASVVVYAP